MNSNRMVWCRSAQILTGCLCFLWLTTVSSRLHAQSSPSFDPDVYLPKIGDGIDTVQSHDTGFFGSGIINLGPGPGSGGFGRIAMQGIPGNEANLTTIKTGHDFDLHKLKVLKHLNLNLTGYHIEHWAHLQSRRINDLVVMDGSGEPKIFWGDSLGNFDSSRFTNLRPPEGDKRFDFWTAGSGTYVARLGADSVEDILWMVTGQDSVSGYDEFLFYSRGGARLWSQGHVAYPDTILFLGRDPRPLLRDFSQADWRGVGRDDLIAIEQDNSTKHNWHYYRNDIPFNLDTFSHALIYDTVFYARENPNYVGQASLMANSFSMRALPKQRGDSSMDFLPMMGKLYIFRIGPDFGTHHLYRDSAEVAITNPVDIDPHMQGLDGWGQGIGNCGDMTGTGNPVIGTSGGILMDGLNFFYVLGKASNTDELADMYIYTTGGISGDSLTGDGDNLEDQLWGNFTYSSLMLIHGSTKIPVHLNSRYAVELRASHAATSLTAFPNPAHNRTVLALESTAMEKVEVIVRDMLGRERFREAHHVTVGVQQIPIQLISLSSGSYVIQVVGLHTHLQFEIAVLR